jgi:ABC-type cobalamin/Fe3+-siderophores transport system ATPase subunit
MKVPDEHGKWIPYYGMSPEKYNELAILINRCLKEKNHVLVCIIGNKGVGKTTLAKFMRKYGFGPFNARQIAVIDDDCMSVDMLYLFRRKYVNPCTGVDELQPFFKYCRKKSIRFYVKSNPESRITRADVLVLSRVNENKRRQRLMNRYGKEKGNRVFNETQSYCPQPKIAYRFKMVADIQ